MKRGVRVLLITVILLLFVSGLIFWFQKPDYNNLAHIYTPADFPNARNSEEGTQRLVENLNTAIQSLREQSPDDDAYTLWITVGNAKVGLGDFEGAQAAYEKAIELDAGQPLAFLNLGTVYKEHVRDFPKAEEYYMQALDRIESPFFSDYQLVADLYVTYWPERKYDIEALMLRGVNKVSGTSRIAYYEYLYRYFEGRDSQKQQYYKDKILEIDPNATVTL